MTYMTVCLRSQSLLISSACQSQPDNGRDILSPQRDLPPRMTAIDSDFRRSGGPFPMRSRRISCPQLAAWKSALARGVSAFGWSPFAFRDAAPGAAARRKFPQSTADSPSPSGSRTSSTATSGRSAGILARARDAVLAPQDTGGHGAVSMIRNKRGTISAVRGISDRVQAGRLHKFATSQRQPPEP